MLMKLWAKLTGGRVVWMQDYDGQITRSIAYDLRSGLLRANRMYGIPDAVLKPNGSVFSPSYVTRWWFEK